MWKEEQATIIREGTIHKEMFRDCIDVWDHYLLKGHSRGLEGIQMATETFRNGMVEEINGQNVPKRVEVVIKLDDLNAASRNLVLEHKVNHG